MGEDPDVSDDDEPAAEERKPDSTESKTAASIFGGSPKPGASIFGGSSSSGSIFGGSAATNNPFKAGGNSFSPSQGKPVFGTPTTSSSIFGGASTPTSESETPKSSGIFTKVTTPGASVFG